MLSYIRRLRKLTSNSGYAIIFASNAFVVANSEFEVGINDEFPQSQTKRVEEYWRYNYKLAFWSFYIGVKPLSYPKTVIRICSFSNQMINPLAQAVDGFICPLISVQPDEAS